ncbi:hypothetical protein GIB67_037563 [Kingdonia uniflora]|uniref:Uncharacterized protein n=1 Tax=Kingdonia uniflora TaxID=39325 RepID=A0A7J7P7N0_9MAGN|nr:hypothetical protein GIB67_037563 [Kingdonia uniflora]
MELCVVQQANSKAKGKTWALANDTADDSQYTQVMRELELIKQELTKLKREMDYVLDQKSLAECKNKSLIFSTEVLRDEIEEANEEQVLVELARIEAVKAGLNSSSKRRRENPVLVLHGDHSKQNPPHIT